MTSRVTAVLAAVVAAGVGAALAGVPAPLAKSHPRCDIEGTCWWWPPGSFPQLILTAWQSEVQPRAGAP